jgi:hypothetical protein
MAGAVRSQSLPPEVREEMETNYQRTRPLASATRLWERVLTERERQRLGGDLQKAWRQHSTVGMWMQLRGVSLQRAVVDVSYELNFINDRTRRWLLRELGEVPDDPPEALKAAIASGDLVLVENPRAAYWRSQPITVDWEKRSVLWNFFWELCQHAKAGKGIDRLTFGTRAHRDIVANQKNRLLAERGFPSDLGKLIKPIGRGTQKLDLPAARIHLFELSIAEPVREWMA